ncbi:MAG TPA: GGDEF domain-containing protein [Pirellulales bacterium]|nr:GGDEF domain-containing protein [Pirellulales bacterium]
MEIGASLLMVLLGVVTVASVAGGALAGWYLRAQTASEPDVDRAAPEPAPADASPAPGPTDPTVSRTALEPERVRQLLSRIRELTENSAASVGEHSTRVQQITQEIAALSGRGDIPLEEAVLDAASRLLEANECLQQELSGAKEKLNEHSQQIEVHMAEARTDGLVGIPNRRAFDEEISRQCAALEQGGPGFSLVLLDIDHFKKFNDRHGHQAGDQVLKQVGQVLSNSSTQRDSSQCDFVARYGGEEFAIIVPATEPHEGRMAAQQVRAAVEAATFDVGDKQLQVTVSLGVVGACAGDNPEAVIRRADEALYAAKKNGRNRAYFFDGAQCVAVDDALCDTSLEVMTAVQNELDRKADHGGEVKRDRRRQPRRPFPSHELIAPYVDSQWPAPSAFRQVQCHDISPGGIAFLLPKLPDYKSIVVALGVAPNITYLAARITHSNTFEADGQPMFLIGCRFTGRLEPQANGDAPTVAERIH